MYKDAETPEVLPLAPLEEQTPPPWARPGWKPKDPNAIYKLAEFMFETVEQADEFAKWVREQRNRDKSLEQRKRDL